jgi:tetratricopeptide (TPR) repeat protein
MRNILFLLSFSLSLFVSAQNKPQIHSPAELIKIMTDSKVEYGLSQLDSVLKPVDYSNKLNFNTVYRKFTGTGFSTVKYSVNKEAIEEETKAEEQFAKGNYSGARDHYLRAYQADTSFYKVMTYIGQTYGIQRDWEKAIEWYRKTIDRNYIDYMAHWFLANAYSATGKKEEALQEILVAHVLNRNNPRIYVSLNSILEENGMRLTKWVFSPQYSVKKNPDNSVEVKYGEGWIVYALTKAIWNFEPGYMQSMGYDNENVFRELEEKEGLIGLLLSEDEKTKALPETKALERATENKEDNLLQEFIFYEILLPQHPMAAYQFPNGLIKNITEYILKVRCDKK